MQRMDEAQWRAFVMTGTRTGKHAVDDQAPMYSYVVIEGAVSLLDDTVAVRRRATDIAARYMGADRGRVRRA